MRQLVAKLIQTLPTAVCARFYESSIKNFSALLASELEPGSYVFWPRNSYRSGRLEYGMSDIDWTVVLTKDQSREKIESSLEKVARKKIYPHGEMNVYWKSDLPQVFLHGNFFELRRDPDLVSWARKIGVSIREAGNPSELVAFLTKMFLSDYHNLKKVPELRKKKWIGHLNDLELDPNLLESFWSLGDVRELIFILSRVIARVMRLDEGESESIGGALHFLGELSSKKEVIYQKEFDFEAQPWIFILGLNWLAFSDRRLPSFSKQQALVGVELVRWEIHASYSQSFYLKNFEAHLSNLYRAQEKHFFPALERKP